MKKRNLMLALGFGAAIGYGMTKVVSERTYIPPEKALESVKHKFQDIGLIEGSWIHMKKEVIKKYGLSYNIYRGGLTLNEDGETIHYEFIVDAETGSILSVQKQ